MFATREGIVKKTEFGAYNTPIKADGIIAIKIRDDDELVAVRRVDGGDEIIMVSRAGQAVRFHEADVRAMGRDTSGVRGMNVSGADNCVLAMDVARPGQELLVVTENGFGKRTAIDEYRDQEPRRDGREDDPADRGARARSPARWSCASTRSSCSSRATGWCSGPRCAGSTATAARSQGVRLMNIREDDVVSAVALVVEPEAAAAATVDATAGPASLTPTALTTSSPPPATAAGDRGRRRRRRRASTAGARSTTTSRTTPATTTQTPPERRHGWRAACSRPSARPATLPGNQRKEVVRS